MSCAAEEDTPSFFRNLDNNDSDSSGNFQKNITELFEKNGILNDLRAYLRGHIVDVLKSAETGAIPACQKHFTQRLELVYQALNMLIAEYLLRLEFSYSLSVFISEIPLANMVFDFAKDLLQTTTTDVTGLRFDDNGVWSVLHYLGIKCDSMHASKIVELYKRGGSPLLYCILKCIPMYENPIPLEEAVSSDECISPSTRSECCEGKPLKSSHSHRSNPHRCKHWAYCESCQNKLLRLKEKYKKRKAKTEKREKSSSVSSLNGQSFLNNVGVLEKGLIDEMFHQLKTVYEAEVDIIKQEEEKTIKRSIANHALQLKKYRDEMEESYKAQEAELEKMVHKKKKFLWGLARALRNQHEHMSMAMKDVQYETKRLAEKESSIQTQLSEAEQLLKNRGKEIHKQISQELLVLEAHLETMKQERDSINKERDELENLKNTYEYKSKIKKNSDEDIDLKTHYITLKDEIVILRKYIESTKESKCLIETGTVMDLGDGVMNNSVDVRGDDDDRLKGSQVINDLKKQKNVNFSQSNIDEIYRQLSHSASRSINSAQEDGTTQHLQASDDGYDLACDTAVKSNSCIGCHGCNREVMLQLREENDRLKNFARQQREHIDSLSSERERLQTHFANNSRPRTAPSVLGSSFFSTTRMDPSRSANAFGWRKGAGEELSMFSSSEPRAVRLPGDAVPFIGVLRERHTDSRRHLISQWRALRRRLSPLGPQRPPAERGSQEMTGISNNVEIITPQVPNANIRMNTESTPANTCKSDKPTRMRPAIDKPREKSPKSVLREAKEKLKNNVVKEPPAPRDKSPNAVLREAKMRLRKLEIEAEAVEKSYLDFRKRQSELREERQNLVLAESSMMKSVNQLEINPSKSLQRLNLVENVATNDIFNYEKSKKSLKTDFDKYLREYQTKFDIGQIHFLNKNSAAQKIKPIPTPYQLSEKVEEPNPKTDYLETPLTEFRKLYQTRNTKKQNDDFNSISPIPSPIETPENEKSGEPKIAKSEIIYKTKKNKQAEFEILKQNVSKIYNLPESSTPNETRAEDISKAIIKNANIEDLEVLDENGAVKENKLMLQIENVRETNNVGVTESNQNLLIVVESSVDDKETESSDSGNEEQKISTQMTIIVTPKAISPTRIKSPCSELSRSPNRLTNTDTLNATFHAENNGLSSVDVQLDLIKGRSESEAEKYIQQDYQDDFSADVDNYCNNYNSISDGGKNSPISLPKTSEDENFWDN